MNFEVLAKPNHRARDPLFYIADYADLNAAYEKYGQKSPHRRQWYFGMNIGRLSWMGHFRLVVKYLARIWIPRPHLWVHDFGWTFQVLWQLADLEIDYRWKQHR